MLDPASQALPAQAVALPSEIAFLTGFGLPPEHLAEAMGDALASGVTADRALLAAGVLSAEDFYRHLATHLGVPFLHDPVPIAHGIAMDDALEVEILPLAPNRLDVDFVVAPRGPTLAQLLQRFSPGHDQPSPRVAVTTPRRLAALVRHRHRIPLVQAASHGLPDWNPRLSARTGWSWGQQVAGFAFGFAAAVGLGAAPLATGQALMLGCSVLFLAMVAVRLLATGASPGSRAPLPVPRRADASLPVYTVVVALYREAAVLPQLVRALMRLDYPRSRLDIKLVLEADDLDTMEAARAARLPDCFEVLLAPAGRPRTKPRALNLALRFAAGQHLVIFDAEDEPEPGQLREAVEVFAAAGSGVGCLQARLAIDNEKEGWLTRLFALEYAALFDVINPGLARLGLPIALGGTSNHFRTEALRRVGGWDAWNVTEDIDLGIRLARFGYRIGVLASTTWEEAPHRHRAWLGQRQRWQKGWMVTLKVHSREPGRLLAELGLRGGLAMAALLTGTILTSLFWPLFALGVVADAVAGPLLHPESPGERAWSALALLLIGAGTLSLLWPALLAARRRGLATSLPWLALLPAYLVLLSLATWRALFDMLGRPYSWTKTEHGVARKRVSRVG